ncbi:MAG: hydantoinase B/oxoprolinase family protein [Rhodobiaceae bacterium]|nr:hydantoinase B/oxoprolinase family protein [Rhodobiaceae bacterium]MCC0048626.1 hydantoinase B/oxoprolinase family protein [Rhodobiaceae bacterium]
MSFDPITLEILSSKIAASAEEMSFTLQRTGRTLFVKETADFQTGIADLSGRFFAYPREIGVSNYMGLDLSPVIRAVPDMEPGDVIITNHPYISEGLATHLPDLHMVRPYFHDDKIVAYGWCFIHCSDVGGKVPSSISPSNDSLYQEGLLIPPTKIVKAGKINEEFMWSFRVNSRSPDENTGDVKAMLAALTTGQHRVRDLIAQHGIDDFMAVQEALQDYSARRAREVLRRIPDGRYEFWDYLDDDYNSALPVRIRVRMDVEDGIVSLDYAGTDPQVSSAYNVPTGNKEHPWLTLRLISFVLTYDKTIPINAGLYRPMHPKAPKGSILNPEAPAAVGVRHATATRVTDTVTGVLTLAAPELMKAPSGGVTVPVVLSEPDPETGGRKTLVVEPMVGGSGGMADKDGVDGRDSGLANLGNNPAESVEASSRVRLLRYGLRVDSAGAGRHRGGCGQELVFQALTDDCQVLGRGMERFRFAPWGIQGGRPGALFEVHVTRADGRTETIGKIDVLVLNEGDIVTMLSPGGGGYGDPFTRDPALVTLDVQRGLVTRGAAEAQYGVAIADDGKVDAAATAALRAVERPAPSQFEFCDDRRAWDAIFDDALMCEFVTLLGTLPQARRIETRRKVLETVTGGVPRAGSVGILDSVGDLDAARARFKQAVSELRAALSPKAQETAA